MLDQTRLATGRILEPIGLIVLRRDTLMSSALMGTISIVFAVLLDMVIPFHFG